MTIEATHIGGDRALHSRSVLHAGETIIDTPEASKKIHTVGRMNICSSSFLLFDTPFLRRMTALLSSCTGIGK
jgi:hypothetical protein